MEKYYIQSPFITNEIIRISSLIIDEGFAELKERELDDNIIVHNLRKRVKNLRALLRLIRKELGEDAFKKNNFMLRDLNRRSAALRNVFALITITGSMQQQNTNGDLIEPYNLLLSRLTNDFETIKSKTELSSLFNNYQDTLEKYNLRIIHMDFDKQSFRNIKAGLQIIYYGCVNSLQNSLGTKDENLLHEWRKNVKDLYYCCLSLTPLWKPVISVYTKELKVLSDLLGDLHDLFELQIYIQSLTDNPFDFTGIFQIIEQMQDNIISNSVPLGKRLFAEDEEQFAQRIKSYYAAYRKEYKQQNKKP